MSAQVAAVQQIPQRVISAWAEQDADAFAGLFTAEATMVLPNDVYIKGRDGIHSFMKRAFAGPYAGTRVHGEPVDVRPLADGVAVLVTRGGVLAPGETEVAPERAIYATWVVQEQDGGWRIAAYQNTPRR